MSGKGIWDGIPMLKKLRKRLLEGLIHLEVPFKKNQDRLSRFNAAFVALHEGWKRFRNHRISPFAASFGGENVPRAICRRLDPFSQLEEPVHRVALNQTHRRKLLTAMKAADADQQVGQGLPE